MMTINERAMAYADKQVNKAQWENESIKDEAWKNYYDAYVKIANEQKAEDYAVYEEVYDKGFRDGMKKGHDAAGSKACRLFNAHLSKDATREMIPYRQMQKEMESFRDALIVRG